MFVFSVYCFRNIKSSFIYSYNHFGLKNTTFLHFKMIFYQITNYRWRISEIRELQIHLFRQVELGLQFVNRGMVVIIGTRT